MDTDILFSINQIIMQVTFINIFDRNMEEVNFFSEALNMEPYQVAMIIVLCSKMYKIDLYSKVQLSDLSLAGIAALVQKMQH